LVAGPRSQIKVRPFFEMAGELLPFFHAGEEFTLLNVITCEHLLDLTRTKWRTDRAGGRVSIEKPVFIEDRLSTVTSSIFKVPETSTGSVLTLVRDSDPAKEFKAFVEANTLTGLIFEEIWSSDT